jgi:hypothetical protein
LTAVPSQHRAIAAACSGGLADAGLPRFDYDGGSSGPTGADGGLISCQADSDCPACANGLADRCFRLFCRCDVCNSDQDCGAGQVCSCARVAGSQIGSLGASCVAANCRVDADCGRGGFCSPTVSDVCGGYFGTIGYYCHTWADRCRDDADCPVGAYCAYSPQAGHWVCGTGVCGG